MFYCKTKPAKSEFVLMEERSGFNIADFKTADFQVAVIVFGKFKKSVYIKRCFPGLFLSGTTAPFIFSMALMPICR
jgi:hypothetical protein